MLHFSTYIDSTKEFLSKIRHEKIVITETILVNLFKFLAYLVIIKKFGAAAQGSVVYLNAIAIYFYVITFSALDASNIFFVPQFKKDRNKLSEYFSCFFILKTVFIILGLVIAYFVLSYTALFSKNVISLPIVLIYAVALTLRQSLKSFFLGLERYYQVTIIYISIEIITFIILLFSTQVTAYIYSYIVLFYLCYFLFFIVIKQHVSFSKVSFKTVVEVMKYGFKMQLNLTLQTITFRLDTFFVMKYFGARILSYYSVAYSFAELITLVPKALTPVIINKTLSTNKANFYFLKQLSAIIILLSFIVLAFFSFAIPIFYGKEYIASLVPFSILCISSAVLSYNYLYSYILLGLKKSNQVFIANIASFVITIIFCYLLIPAYGLIGAAIASLIAYSLIFIQLAIQLKNVNHNNYTFDFIVPNFKSIILEVKSYKSILKK